MVHSDLNKRQGLDYAPLEIASVDTFVPGTLASQSGKELNRVFLNGEADGARRFDDVSGISGLDAAQDARVAAFLDYDRDGRRDVAVVNANAPLLQLFRNEVAPRAGFIDVELVGGNDTAAPMPGFAPRDGYGARVELELVDPRSDEPRRARIVREARCGEGFAGQNARTLLIGIGEAEHVDRLRVRWPSGRALETSNVPAGTRVTVYERPERSPSGSPFVLEPYGGPARPSEPPARRTVAPSLDLPVSPGQADARLRAYVTMATWCTSCLRELPHVARLREVFDENDLALYGVPVDPEDSESLLAAYQESFAPAYELLAGMDERSVEALEHFGVRELGDEGLPKTFVLDADGGVRLARWGVPSVSEIRRLLRH